MNNEGQIVKLANELRNMNIDAHNGMQEELFLLVSGIMPIPNVDLMITNENNQLLFSWRDDPYFGQGWHFPGGCIRFGETMLERVQKTAMAELGTILIVEENPLAIKDVICDERENLKYSNERGHHLAVLFRCKVPYGFKIDNKGKKENEVGYLKWFDFVPDNLVHVHDVYEEILKEWKEKR